MPEATANQFAEGKSCLTSDHNLNFTCGCASVFAICFIDLEQIS